MLLDHIEMADDTSSSAQRSKLLRILTKITDPSTTLSEQRRLIATLHTTAMHTLEECLLQVCHVCITCTIPAVKDMLRAFMLSLAARSFYVALRLSWNIDSVLSMGSFAAINDRIRDIQDSIESYAINQVGYRGQTSHVMSEETSTCAGAVACQTEPCSRSGGERIGPSRNCQHCPVRLASESGSPDQGGVGDVSASGDTGASRLQPSAAAAEATSHLTTSSAVRGDVTVPVAAVAVAPPASTSPACGSMDDMVVSVEHALRKERRLKMFNDERQFIAMLTDISNALSCYSDREVRMRELARRLREINKLLPSMSVIHPLGGSSDPVSWIVSIAIEEAVVFSSRLRAPYLICYEVIVDRTATMRDPAQTSLRLPDGRFRCSAASDEVFALHDPPHNTMHASKTAASSATRGHDRRGSYSSRPGNGDDRVQSVTHIAPTRSAEQCVHCGCRASHVSNNSSSNHHPHSHSAGTHSEDMPHSLHSCCCARGEQRDRKERDESSYLRSIFPASARARKEAMRRRSVWAAHPNWDMRALIVKAGDDLRQEELALQLIHVFSSLWREAQLTCWVRPYSVIATGMNCGVMGVVQDAMSIDAIKKAGGVTSLYQFYVKAFDGERSRAYRRAQQNFIETMAGYSIVSYILQVKDRHNANLMISRTGELTHIDFGYFISTSPGGIGFESAPFKLSQDHIDIMGGSASDGFNYYRILLYQGLTALGGHVDDIVALLSLIASFTTIPCFGSDPLTSIAQLRGRFRHDLPAGADYALYIRDLIMNSADNWRTRRYDQFQTLQNGIL